MGVCRRRDREAEAVKGGRDGGCGTRIVSSDIVRDPVDDETQICVSGDGAIPKRQHCSMAFPVNKSPTLPQTLEDYKYYLV